MTATELAIDDAKLTERELAELSDAELRGLHYADTNTTPIIGYNGIKLDFNTTTGKLNLGQLERDIARVLADKITYGTQWASDALKATALEGGDVPEFYTIIRPDITGSSIEVRIGEEFPMDRNLMPALINGLTAVFERYRNKDYN